MTRYFPNKGQDRAKAVYDKEAQEFNGMLLFEECDMENFAQALGYESGHKLLAALAHRFIMEDSNVVAKWLDISYAAKDTLRRLLGQEMGFDFDESIETFYEQNNPDKRRGVYGGTT